MSQPAAEAQRRYRQRHPERIAAQRAAYDKAHRDELNAYKRKRWAEGKNRPTRSRADYQRDYRLKKLYGISLDEYEERLRVQGGKCVACRSDDPGRKGTSAGLFVVDHDHVTGKVRGLLCHPCNMALGMAGDSVDRLMQLVAYLLEER